MTTGIEQNIPAASAVTSPYAPPQAGLEKAAGDAPDRPWQVGRAVMLLWVSFGIGTVSTVFNLVRQAGRVPLVLVFGGIGMVVGALIAFWIYGAIAKGRNWARLLFLILSPFWLLTLPIVVFQFSQGLVPGISLLLTFVNFVMAAYVFYLLLTGPARAWFREMKERN